MTVRQAEELYIGLGASPTAVLQTTLTPPDAASTGDSASTGPSACQPVHRASQATQPPLAPCPSRARRSVCLGARCRCRRGRRSAARRRPPQGLTRSGIAVLPEGRSRVLWAASCRARGEAGSTGGTRAATR
jgi:hypothetical protein